MVEHASCLTSGVACSISSALFQGNTALLSLLFAAASLLTPLTPAVPLPTGDGLPAKAPSAVGMSAALKYTLDPVNVNGI
jgi:hypothetical protein